MSIITDTRNGVARIQIARPEKKNAITAAMYAAMAEAITQACSNDAVGALLIYGQPDVFTSGNDLEDFAKSPPQGEDAPVLQFIRALGGCELPVVAAVNGAAVGIGATLLLHCELAYCATDSVLSMPFVSLGLCPEFASSVLLPLFAGWHKAAEKLLLGDPIRADEAVEMRMVNAALPPEAVLAHATAQAERFAALPRRAVRASKQLMRRGLCALVQPVIEDEVRLFTELLRGPEAREAFRAFFERRRPEL